MKRKLNNSDYTEPPKYRTTEPPKHRTTGPRFALRKGLGFWELTFNGKTAIFKHEQGANYIAYLLLNPPAEPIHALDLVTRIAAADRKQAYITHLADPHTGQTVLLDRDARLQERSLGIEAANTMRATLRAQEQLEAMLEDEDVIEPVKVQAQRDLIDLYDFEKKHTPEILDSAQKAVRAVSMAIKRLHRNLASATDSTGQPNHVLRPFADHILQCVLIPSGRYPGAGRARAKAGLAGCFTYQPHKRISWKM